MIKTNTFELRNTCQSVQIRYNLLHLLFFILQQIKRIETKYNGFWKFRNLK